MNRNASCRVVFIGLLAATTLLFQCNQPPNDLPPPSVGGAGEGGAPSNAGGAGGSNSSSGGGSGNRDATVAPNLDVAPIWWGTADAPQGPEVVDPPSIDANCGQLNSETVRKPADVLLVLDGSGSLKYSITENCYCVRTDGTNVCADTTNCGTRLAALQPALSATLSSSKNINWGLKIFPTPSGGSGDCIVSTGVEVPVSATSATAMQQQINSMSLKSSTPTRKALESATAYLKSLTDTNEKFILLATDGEPNCLNDRSANADLENTVIAAQAAKDAGFKVYVIGIGPQLQNLTSIAAAGGTTDYYPVSSPEQLAEVLSSISKFVGSCTFSSTDAPPDPENVAVYVNKQRVEKSADEGWTYGDTPRDIKLTGSYCEHITAGEETAVQILFGCPGSPPFPPWVP
jgi:hypothetical protein